MHHDHRHRHVEFGHRWNGRQSWNFELEFLPGVLCESLALVGELNLNRKGLAVAADAEVNDASGRRLMDHAAQLRTAFDVGAVHGENDVMLSKAGLSGGSILIHHGDFHPALFLQLESRKTVGRDVGDIYPEIGSGAEFLTGVPVSISKAAV